MTVYHFRSLVIRSWPVWGWLLSYVPFALPRARLLLPHNMHSQNTPGTCVPEVFVLVWFLPAFSFLTVIIQQVPSILRPRVHFFKI